MENDAEVRRMKSLSALEMTVGKPVPEEQQSRRWRDGFQRLRIQAESDVSLIRVDLSKDSPSPWWDSPESLWSGGQYLWKSNIHTWSLQLQFCLGTSPQLFWERWQPMSSKRRSIAVKVACVIPVMTTSEPQRFNSPEVALWKLAPTDPR